MNINNYPEVKPKTKWIKKIYIAVMLFIVGRAIQAASKIDKTIKKQFEDLPEGFTFSLGVLPDGPYMIVGKDKKSGKVKYMGWNPIGKNIDLKMGIKNTESAILLFTFQESTTVAFAHDRYIVEGDLVNALSIVRVLDLVEVYLLPKIITKLAVKRYPKWSELNPFKKHLNRILIYIRTFTV